MNWIANMVWKLRFNLSYHAIIVSFRICDWLFKSCSFRIGTRTLATSNSQCNTQHVAAPDTMSILLHKNQVKYTWSMIDMCQLNTNSLGMLAWKWNSIPLNTEARLVLTDWGRRCENFFDVFALLEAVKTAGGAGKTLQALVSLSHALDDRAAVTDGVVHAV